MEGSVLIITEVFNPEEFLINDIAQKWVEEGKQVSVLTRNPAYPYGKIYSGHKNSFYSKRVENGMIVHRYHIIQNYRDNKIYKILNYVWNTVLATTLAITLFRKSKNIFIYHTGPLTVALPGVLLKKLNRGKVVIWTQDIWPDVVFAFGLRKNRLTVWFMEMFVNFIYTNCNKVITTSRQVQKDIQKRVNTPPFFIPNWPMKAFQNKEEEIKISTDCKFTFTFAGNIGVMQNLNTIVMAFHQWSMERQDVQLFIYGDGSAQGELTEILQRNAIKNVVLKGRVPVEEIPAIYKASDVLLISLRNDEVLEKYVPAKFSTYLTSGKPIFGILSGAVMEYIQEYKLGYVVEPEKIEELAKGFSYFVQMSQTERAKIRERALLLYKLEFDAEVNLSKLTQIVFH